MTFRESKCPACGADLPVPANADVVTCQYCRKDIVVRDVTRGGSAPQIGNLMQLAVAASESGNQEEAYNYFTRILEIDSSNHDAWFGKAAAAGWSSNLQRNRYSELLSGIQRAVELAPEEKKIETEQRGAEVVSEITRSYFQLSSNHLHEFVELDDTWEDHVERCFPMLEALEDANDLDPTSREVLSAGIFISQQLSQGVRFIDPYDTSDGIRFPKTKHLTPLVDEQVKRSMGRFVAKMKALEPGYEAPAINKATSGVGAAMLVAAALGLVLLIWIILA